MPDLGPTSNDVTSYRVSEQTLVENGPPLPLSSRPRRGRLVPLKTKLEVSVKDDTVEVYIVPISATSASALLSVLRENLPKETAVDLQHLRRLVKPEHVPAHLRAVPSSSANSESVAAVAAAAPTLYLLVSLATVISPSSLGGILSRQAVFQAPPEIRTIPVPLYAPTSASQAVEWSARYWPTVYKNSNPFGPQPDVFAKATAEIAAEAGERMGLADRVARESRDQGWGEAIGAVVVSDETCRSVHAAGQRQTPAAKAPSKVVVVAGDARYVTPVDRPCSNEDSFPSLPHGNPAAHAVMRAIALVASARLALASSPPPGATPPNTADPCQPLTPLESLHHALTSSGNGGLLPNGYLCLNLTLYTTHEPCVMCSMALLHSRFGRVIIHQRMPRTGAICAEPATEETRRASGYGLWWRRDMNWKMLGWEWLDEAEPSSMVSDDIHA